MAGVKISALPASSATNDVDLAGVEAGTTVKLTGSISGAQVITALGFTPAPINSPTFTGTPSAPTPSTADNSTRLATTAYVQAQGYVTALTAPVTSVAGKTGAVLLVVSDVTGAAPIASPTFTGVPAAPTAAPGTNTTQLATTAFVIAQAYQAGIQFQNQGTNVGGVGTEGVVNFTGGGVTASDSGGILTVNIPISMPANTIKGNNTGSTTDALNLTPGQVAAMLPVFTQFINGLVPAVGIAPSNTTFLCSDGTFRVPGGGSSPGTVTSVDFAAPVQFAVSGNPITGAGTITLAWNSAAQNLVLATPNGSSGVPSLRALVNADFPTSGVTLGTYGDSTHVAQVTVNSQGIVTGVTNVAITAGGSGTVTSFSAGTLSPLFTTSVATATTTPALSFSLSNAAAHTFFGNFTGGSTTPSFGSPTLASADFANQGTATQVLHGNASGNPSWGAVVLTTDVSGILPIANGGTNASSAATALSNLGGQGVIQLKNQGISIGTAGQATTYGFTGAGVTASILGAIATFNIPGGGASAGVMYFGDGSDGDIILDGTNTYSFLTKSGSVYTATRDIYVNNISYGGSGQLDMGFNRLFCYGQWDPSGTSTQPAIKCTANNGTAGSGASQGIGGAAGSQGGSVGYGGAGAAGATAGTGVGGNGSAGSKPIGTTSNGGRGGPSTTVVNSGGTGSGGVGGNSTAATAPTPFVWRRPDADMYVSTGNASGTPSWQVLTGGGGGSGGGAGGGGGGSGGGGGGAGAGGNVIYCAIRTIVITNGLSGVISVVGGNGANGGNPPGTNAGGGGGGSGGGGGLLHFVYQNLTGTGSMTLTAAGGSGGNGGIHTGTGTDGLGGTGGTGGMIIGFDITAGVATTVTGSAGSAPSGTSGGAGGACTFTLTN